MDTKDAVDKRLGQLMQKIALYGKSLTILLFTVFSLVVNAQTAQQIEQFKRLPPAQQQALAQQMGVDISTLLQQTPSSQQVPQVTQPQGYPEGTVFDEYGNPIYNPIRELDADSVQIEPEPELYGRSLFDNAPTMFTPVSDVAVPSSYLLAPGDQLVVQLYGKENQQYPLIVNAEGNIIVPRFGPLNVASKTFLEAKQYVAEKISEQVIGVNVNVSMGELRTLQVFVAGEANRPGAYNVSSLSTITHALFISGGVTDIASLRNIQLKRSGKLVRTLDIYDLLMRGDTSDDALLQAGDVVFVPSFTSSITIKGNVRRPAIYELKNESSFDQALRLAGGVLPDAYTKAISIERFVDGVRTQLTVAANDSALTIENGDVITVSPASEFVNNSVSLIGAVPRPGRYQWRNAMKVSDIIKNPQVDALMGADLSYVLIVRDNGTQISTYQINLIEGEDFLLDSNDTILVFSEDEDIEFGDVSLEDLAFTESQLQQNQQSNWQNFVEQQKFWQSLGLIQDPSEQDELDEQLLSTITPVVNLSDDVKERMLELIDMAYFSRKRLLTPVIEKLQKRAGFSKLVKLVEIDGEVRVPGVYPLTEGATIKDIIVAAGGLTESAFADRSELTRTLFSTAGAADVQHISFSPQSVINNNADNVRLQSRDRINVFTTPSWQEDLRITVRGEVEFPGVYTIKRGERLSGLIDRVGGLTEFGEASSAIFTRRSLQERERTNLRKLAQDLRKQIASESLRRQSGAGGIVSYDQAKQLLRDLVRVEAVGRLVIDLDAIILGEERLDVTLQDGDTLYIPGKAQAVNVIGEVFVPTSHLFTAELSFEDYISRSGGFRELADEQNAYIIRADGSVVIPNKNSGFWFNESSNSNIMPGDTIVVPLDSGHVDNVTLWTNVTQIVYQLAVTIAAIGSL